MRWFSKINNYKDFWGEILAGGLGGLFFLYFWGEILDPTYVDWAIIGGIDTFQHYIGWLFYKDNSFTYPIGLVRDLGYPVGIPILYMDSIPIAAFLFKILSPLLPAEFQYFGIWALFSFVLQGVLGYKLVKQIFNDKTIIIVSSLFFIISPIMIFRLAHHISLVSHWIILAGLYLIIKYRNSFPTKNWLLLEVLSVLIHPYFLFMITPLMIVHLTDLYFNKDFIFKKVILHLFNHVLVILVVSFVTGVFYIGNSAAPGLGDFSMNLNALFNPLQEEWSRFLNPLSTHPSQREGFNYLGLGMLILLPLSILSFFYHFSLSEILGHIKRYWSYYMLGLGFTAFAISPHVRWNDHTLVDISIPVNFLRDILSTFRSSGRFFWPVYYSLFLIALYGVKITIQEKSRLILVVIILVCSIQVYDLSAHLIYYEQTKYKNKTWQVSLPDYWQVIAKKYNHIKFIPSEPQVVLQNSNYPDIMVFAARNDISVNTTKFSRKISGKGKHIRQEINHLKRGQPDLDSVYIITDNFKQTVKDTTESDLIVKQKNFILYAPEYYGKIKRN